MSFDEENLDDLLKSFMENGDESNHLTEDEEDIIGPGSEEAVPSDFAMDFGDSDTIDNEFAIEDFGMDEPEMDMPEALDSSAEEEFSLNDFAIQEPDIDDYSMEDMEKEEEAGKEGKIEDDEKDADLLSFDEIEKLFSGGDLIEEEQDTDLENSEDDSLLNKNVEDDDLAEISGLLHSGGNDSVEDDMLALLESMSADLEVPEEVSSEKAEGSTEEDTGTEEDGNKEQEKKKSFFSKLFKKKDKNKGQAEETESDSIVGEEDRLIDMDGVGGLEEEILSPKKEKKQNIFSKFMAFLTETDGDDETEKLKEEHGMEPSDENRNILEELDKEDKKKKKKKLKGKNKEDNDEDSLEGDEEIVIKDTKKKKEKKQKAQELSEDVKPEKKVSKKNIAIIAGLGVTLTAVVVVLCTIVPGFFEKRAAREAYYASDYSKSYELLYGKKLDNSDTIIYNKSKIILELNRKLTSYHNYISMGKEVQALDALISGIQKYPDIYEEAELYHVTQEVSAIYETILNILNDRYGISEAVAKVINDIKDDLEYTKKLESIIYGTPFVESGEEMVTDKPAAADVLPEEEAVIGEAVQPQQTAEEINRISLEDELPIAEYLEDGQQTEQEEAVQAPQEPAAEEPAEQVAQPEVPIEEAQTPDTGSSNGQGQLIQGIRQPIDIEIHGN